MRLGCVGVLWSECSAVYRGIPAGHPIRRNHDVNMHNEIMFKVILNGYLKANGFEPEV